MTCVARLSSDELLVPASGSTARSVLATISARRWSGAARIINHEAKWWRQSFSLSRARATKLLIRLLTDTHFLRVVKGETRRAVRRAHGYGRVFGGG